MITVAGYVQTTEKVYYTGEQSYNLNNDFDARLSVEGLFIEVESYTDQITPTDRIEGDFVISEITSYSHLSKEEFRKLKSVPEFIGYLDLYPANRKDSLGQPEPVLGQYDQNFTVCLPERIFNAIENYEEEFHIKLGIDIDKLCKGSGSASVIAAPIISANISLLNTKRINERS